MCEWCKAETNDTFTHKDEKTGEKSICPACLYEYVRREYPGGAIEKMLEREYGFTSES